MSSFMLSRHAYLCVSGSYVVFLDLRRDRYCAFERTEVQQLASQIAGWPLQTGGVAASSDPVPKDAERIARKLLAEQLLTTDPNAGKPATPVSADALLDELGGEFHDQPIRIGLGDFIRYGTACLVARLALRFMSIERVVERIRARRARRADRDRHVDSTELRRLVAITERLRPFAFTARDACLFDSLALLEFLAMHGLFPAWVFGVQMAPFSAHCWIQRGNAVLNDTVEHAEAYTPIMVV